MGLSNTKVESNDENSDHSISTIIHGGNEIFKNAMLKPWKCEGNPFTFHLLLDNVLTIVFQSQAHRNYVLKERPWSFENKLILMQP